MSCSWISLAVKGGVAHGVGDGGRCARSRRPRSMAGAVLVHAEASGIVGERRGDAHGHGLGGQRRPRCGPLPKLRGLLGGEDDVGVVGQRQRWCAACSRCDGLVRCPPMEGFMVWPPSTISSTVQVPEDARRGPRPAATADEAVGPSAMGGPASSCRSCASAMRVAVLRERMLSTLTASSSPSAGCSSAARWPGSLEWQWTLMTVLVAARRARSRQTP